MKYSIFVKFIAFLLCACSLVAAAGCAFGIFYLGESNLYNRALEERRQEELENIAYNIGWYYARRYAAEAYSDCSDSLVENYLSEQMYYTSGLGSYDYSVSLSENGAILQEYHSGNVATAALSPTENVTYEHAHFPLYPVRQDTELTLDPDDLHYSEYFYDGEVGEYVPVDLYAAPVITVAVTVPQDIVYSDELYTVTELLYQHRYNMIYVLLGSLLIFAVTLVYLCCAAGRSNGTREIRPMGLNRLPLDVYGLCVFFGCIGLGWLGAMLLEWAVDSDPMNVAGLILAAVCALGFSVLCIAFVFAFAAQAKIKNHYWLRHTLCGWCVDKVVIGLRWCFRGCRSIIQMLPLMWQWLLTAFGMVCAVAFTFLMAAVTYGFSQMFWVLLCLLSVIGCIGIVCYGAWAFGVLFKGATVLAQGNLYYQINTKYLIGCFRDFALELNSLAGAARITAANQLKSERMKTELITNVSHDIKTPLTSIINYVDLLQKPHTEEEQNTYLEVLSRQSLRLKKLIDDLMDMSKASTGNMHVEVSRVDAVESVNQALGEFADKLETAGLMPIFRHPETPVIMLADGRLTWRVLSNLLSNAVKYAMPGTRLYLDLMQLEGSVVISLKNISREELNVNAEELMERFVRGDQSRNTEGSGLGLNIAKSLMDLQNGQLQLLVDGDLFKVTLIFPAG